MITFAGILASIVTVLAGWFMAANIELLSAAPGMVIVLALVAGFAFHMALWVGSFYLFCRILGAR